MKKNLLLTLTLCIIAACSGFLLGCNKEVKAPVPMNPIETAQVKLHATEHWQSLAEETSMRVLDALEDRPDLLSVPVYINYPNNRSFSVAFYNFLRSELVSRGVQISYRREANSAILEYTIQTISFGDERFVDTAPLAGDDASEHKGSTYTSGADNEIIVNSRLYFNNRFVVHHSAIRYINDEDWALYIDPQVSDPLAESSRSINIKQK